jgi:ABC-3C protein
VKIINKLAEILMAEQNNNNQSIKGSNNKQAGGDINETHLHYHGDDDEPLIFYEEDIKDIISIFSENVDAIKPISDDFKRIDIELKNKKNNVSNDYFTVIQEESLPHFKKIETFLKDPANNVHLKFYENIIADLKTTITVHREEYDKFDAIFEAIYKKVLNKFNENIKSDRRLIYAFLHYMYWNCDIGEK